MFDDVDRSLRALLIADVPLDPTEVDISFARPTREWSSRLAGPTLNMFLFDIRERVDFRDDSWRVAHAANGSVTRERLPRRVDLSYVVTAWTREPEDEHRILGRVLAALYRNLRVPQEHLQGALAEAEASVLLRIPPPDHLQKAVDFWGVMDNELRSGLTWVVTTPLDVFAPQTGPMVLTRELLVGPLPEPADRRQTYLVAGVLRGAGEAAEPVAGARITVAGTARSARTANDGRFRIDELLAGDYTLHVEPPGGAPFDRAVSVPSAGYDLELPAEGSAQAAAPARRRGARPSAE